MAACLALSCKQRCSGPELPSPEAWPDEECKETVGEHPKAEEGAPEVCYSRSQKLLRTVSQKLRSLKVRQEGEGEHIKDLRTETEQKKERCYHCKSYDIRSRGFCKGTISKECRCEGKERQENQLWDMGCVMQSVGVVERQEGWRLAKYFGLYRRKDRVKDEIDKSEEMRSTVQSAVSASEREEEDEEAGKEEGEELRGPTLRCFGFYGERERKRWGSLRSQQKIKDTESGNALEKGISRNGDAEGFGESTEESQEWEEGHVTATCVGCFRVERQCSQVRAREEDGMETAEVSKDEAIRTENGEDQLPVLPDDILEMCLARAPLLTLMQARIVCKKWRSLTISAHFLQLREKIPSRKPWLFLFGLSRDGVCMGQIQGLDPTSEKWFSIKADNLTGRLLYSVAAIGSSIYVLGGCSSATFPPGRPEKGTLRTHKTVLIFNVLTGQWRKGCSMSVARSMPIVGIFEIKDRHFINENQDCRGDRVNLQQITDVRRRYRSRRNSEVDVYGGYQAFRSGNALGHNRIADYQGLQSAGVSQQVWQTYGKLDWAEKQENNHLGGSTAHRMERDGCWQKNGRKGPIRPYSRHRSMSELKRYGLIVVGGQGACNEPLESAEVYDLLADRWIKIASWPAEYGAVCSGVVCKGLFFAYSETDKLAAYDFDQGLWIGITVSGIPPRLHEYLPKLISCNDRIFLIGVAWRDRVNTVREKASRKLWELLEAGSSRMWVEVSQHPDAPLDWNAVFVAHEERIFGVEMFKIFGQVLDFVTVCDVSSSPIKWDRVSRRRMAQDMDASSCLTKTAVVLQL